MLEPTFDKDGYPTEDTLQTIRMWEEDFSALMEFVAKAWKWDDLTRRPSKIEPLFDRKHKDDGYWWCGATGGWSGNEDLIGALQDNRLFWFFCWRASVRGGYFEFHVKPTSEV